MSVRKEISKVAPGTWLRCSDFEGSPRAVEQALSRAARDEQDPLVRVARGVYYMTHTAASGGPGEVPGPVEVACHAVEDRGVGPAGLWAFAHLGLVESLVGSPHLTVTGAAPVGVEGVVWEVRKNPARAQLSFDEQAALEVLCVDVAELDCVDVSWGVVRDRVAAWAADGRVDLDAVVSAAASERRKPMLTVQLAQVRDRVAELVAA